MAGEAFTDCIVGEIAAQTRNALVGGPFGSDLVSKDYVPTGVPVIRGTNMGHGRWIDGEFAYVTPEKAESLSSNCAKPGDIVFTQRGTLGQVALVPNKGADRYLISQSQMKLTVDAEKADAMFLYYVFTSAEQQDYIRQNAIQTGVPHTNLGILRNTPLTLPPLAEQKAIAAVLGALDDKIELNRQMNATLEAMARALFQSWFVDFDPVRAKMEGREPSGMDAETAALFPDGFEESELGLIPRGWQTGSILRQADLLSGGTPKTDVPAFWNGDVPWASAKDVSQCGEAFLVSTERTITKRGLEESSTKMIPANATVVVARGATTGRLTMFGHAMAMNQTCYGLRSQVGAPFALYCNARHFIERLVQGGHGSIFDTITTSTFEATEVLLAPTEVLRAFDSQVTALFQQVHANLHESRTLATLRDTLLPKLLSGELRVNDISLPEGTRT
jgi:type I restriction enzyme S subunit